MAAHRRASLTANVDVYCGLAARVRHRATT
jgi:hypothetical protein